MIALLLGALSNLLISWPSAVKLFGQILILAALGLQLYVLNGESRLRIDAAVHEAAVSHHEQFLTLASRYDPDNPIIARAVEIHLDRMKKDEIRWQRTAKIRSQKILSLSNVSYWAALLFILGTVLFSLGEYLSYRREYDADH